MKKITITNENITPEIIEYITRKISELEFLLNSDPTPENLRESIGISWTTNHDSVKDILDEKRIRQNKLDSIKRHKIHPYLLFQLHLNADILGTTFMIAYEKNPNFDNFSFMLISLLTSAATFKIGLQYYRNYLKKHKINAASNPIQEKTNMNFFEQEEEFFYDLRKLTQEEQIYHLMNHYSYYLKILKLASLSKNQVKEDSSRNIAPSLEVVSLGRIKN